MQCPICSVELVMSERQGIEIDYCPKCRGVWLDRGELDKIIEKAVPSSAMKPEKPTYAPEQFHSHDDHHKHSHGYKRKKSFLEELFD